MNNKNTKTILFGALIAAMILPFSGMQFVEAIEEDIFYEKKVKTNNTYKNLDNIDKAKFDKNLKESIKNASPYQKKVNTLLNKLAHFDFKIEDAVTYGKDTTKLEQKQAAIIFDLEKYGVVTKERLHQNPEYWAERAYDAKVQIEKGKEVSISLESKNNNELYLIHTDDVSLKTQAQISYICATYTVFNIPVYCMNIDVDWGGNSTAYASQWIAFSGEIVTLAKTCIENDGDHNQVVFTFDTRHYANSIFGESIWDVIHPSTTNYLTYEGTCAQFQEDNTFINGGYYAYVETHLDEAISVVG